MNTLKITIHFLESEVNTIPVKSGQATFTCTVSVVITVLKHLGYFYVKAIEPCKGC